MDSEAAQSEMKLNSLKFKCISGICGLVFFVSLLLLLFLSLQFHNQLEIELHKRGASISRNLAEAANKPILTENHVSLQLLVNDLKKNEEDIHYIYIISKQGQILSHTFGFTFPNDLLKLDHPDMNIHKPLVQKLQIEQDEVVDFTSAIQLGDFGRVHVGLSEKTLKTREHEVLLYIAPLAGLILLFGVASAWWFASKITTPIIALSKNAQIVAEGQLDGYIPVTSHDELGELTAAFNSMIADLKKRTDLQLQTEAELRLQAAIMEDEIAQRQMAQEALSVKQYQLEGLNSTLEERIKNAIEELRMKDRVMLAQGRQAAMGEMINNIAHQWRQPLNNLGLIVQNIKVDYDCGTMTSDSVSNDVDKVMNTIMFMSQTINDFRDFFSPDSAKKVFPIIQSFTKVIAMIEASLSKQNIQLVIERQDEGIAVEGYFNEYNQVILNLLNNAKDALLEQKVEQPVINISIAHEDVMAVVRISDNAGGIPADILDKIFEPYFTTKEHGKGNGIGLYMSKTIIEEHFGGTLTAVNFDAGAQFIITVPQVPEG